MACYLLALLRALDVALGTEASRSAQLLGAALGQVEGGQPEHSDAIEVELDAPALLEPAVHHTVRGRVWVRGMRLVCLRRACRGAPAALCLRYVRYAGGWYA